MSKPKQPCTISEPVVSPTAEFALPANWQVFGPVDKNLLLPREKLARIPAWIEAGGARLEPQPAEAQNGRLELASFIGGKVTGKSAYVFIPFSVDCDQTINLGFGADHWFDAYLDGEPICDNLDTGSWNYPPTVTDYLEPVKLTRGEHLLVIRFISGSGLSVLCAAVFHNHGVKVAGTRKFKVDFASAAGAIKPQLHGVNHGPLCFSGCFDFADLHREMGLVWVRPCEQAWTAPDTVDVHAIFPLFHAEADDPRNYRFPITDDFLKSILDAGEKIYYRLGETTAPGTHGRHWIQLPADFDKWARICVNIIRHYNDGWADGFQHGIEHWEIWNNPCDGDCWAGTKEEYFALYATAARVIKAYNPCLKVGGGGAPWTGEYGRDFIRFCAKNKVPLDFFTWHSRSCRPEKLMFHAREIRRMLDDAGLTATESHLNQWSYEPPAVLGSSEWADQGEKRIARCTDAEGAAFYASAMISFHDAPVDAAHAYWGRDGASGALDIYGVQRKLFHAIKAFHQMLAVPHRVYAEGSESATGLAVLAGVAENRQAVRILLSNFQHPDEPMKLCVCNLPWTGRSLCDVRIVDAAHDLKIVHAEEREAGDFVMPLRLPPGTVALVEMKRIESKEIEVDGV